MRFAPLICAVLFAAPVYAGAPEISLHPTPRPDQTGNERPERLVLVSLPTGVQSSPRPQARPNFANSGVRAQAATPTRSVTQPIAVSGKRAICNRKSIRGENLAPIAGRLNGCGVQQPVRVFAVAGVSLSQGAIMDCRTARSLDRWVSGSVKPTLGRLGGGVASLQVAAHYSCRTRNSKPGAKISEHGKGHAIDISAINLKNGESLTVLKGWRDKAQGKILRSLHKAACGPFGTVLGPNADRHHQDHFHLDTARYRSGSYCR